MAKPSQKAASVYRSRSRVSTDNMMIKVKTLSDEPRVLIVMTMGLSTQMAERTALLLKNAGFSTVFPGKFRAIKTPVKMSHMTNKTLPKCTHMPPHALGTSIHASNGV